MSANPGFKLRSDVGDMDVANECQVEKDLKRSPNLTPFSGGCHQQEIPGFPLTQDSRAGDHPLFDNTL